MPKCLQEKDSKRIMFKSVFKYTLFLMLMMLMPSGLAAQMKQLSQAKDYLKTGKNLDKAESLIQVSLPTLRRRIISRLGRCLSRR